MRNYRPPRRDGNETAIVEALRDAGAFVTRLDQRDVPDLLVAYRGSWFLLEVKLPTGPKGGEKDRKLTEGQVEFFLRASQHGCPVRLVRNPKDALEAIGACDSLVEDPHGR